MIKLDLTVSATVTQIQLIESICERILKQVEFCEIKKVCFILHEAIINAIEATERIYHENSKNKELRILFEVSNNNVFIKIIDDAGGIPYDILNKISNNNFIDVLFEERGRGLLLIKELVDECWHEFEGKHTLVIIIKGEN